MGEVLELKMLQICPKCKEKAVFTPEQMPCDGSLVAWCNSCGDPISQTITIQTLKNLNKQHMEDQEPGGLPVSEALIEEIEEFQAKLQNELGFLFEDSSVELHFRDFNSYAKYRK